jgi:hypothetical protein
MFKIKHERTADCVVAGYRVHKTGDDAIGSLLLGLYRRHGELASVGRDRRVPDGRAARAVRAELQPLVTTFEGHPWNWAAGGGRAGGDPHPAQLRVQPVERRQGPVVRPAAPGAGGRGALRPHGGHPVPAHRAVRPLAPGPRTLLVHVRQLEEPVSYSLSEIPQNQLRTDRGDMASPKIVIEVAGREVAVSNPQKVYFPRTGHTKLDLVRYYLAVADGALRGVAGRPMALKRFVNGAEAEPFFQKRAPTSRPDWIETAELRFPSGRTADEVVLRDAAGLAWVANLGCIDLNPHPVRRPTSTTRTSCGSTWTRCPGSSGRRSSRWRWWRGTCWPTSG